jgi:type IV pilus assembly protein PilP
MIIRPLLLILGIFFACVLLVACDESVTQTSTTPPKKSVAAPVAVAAATGDEPAEAVYVYNPIGTRDPFNNPLRAMEDVADTGLPLTPLQKFDLAQLRLIGLIIGKGEPRAMVIAPDKKSFILKVGTKVGKNSGEVVAVTTTSVQVKEQYVDYSGEVKTRIEEIKLPQQGGAK